MRVHSQEVIATVKYPSATANHNQRKIIRDSEENIYVVYTDSSANKLSVKGLYYTRSTDIWSDPVNICEGTNPSIAINKENCIFLLFQSNDSVSKIKMKCSDDFTSWSDGQTLSDTLFTCYLPVADSDSDGILNIMWIQKNGNGTNSCMYVKVQNEEHILSRVITTKDKISDIAIANSLGYQSNVLYFAYRFSTDSIIFCCSDDYLISIDSVYKTQGSQPGLTYNEDLVRLLYIDNNNNLIQREQIDDVECCFEDEILHASKVDYICVDDIVPHIGYSYLFIKNDSLFHGFSQERGWPRMILDTISTNPIYPSIAYKQFNVEYIDFIWMESADSGFKIYYKRDEKYQYIYPNVETETVKGFKITGYPNPFTKFLNITVEIEQNKHIPSIDIFDAKSRLITSLNPEKISDRNYHFKWIVTDNSEVIPQGLYFIRCTVGNNRITKKVIKLN